MSDNDVSFNFGDDSQQLRGLTSLLKQNSKDSELGEEAIMILESDIDKILISAWNGDEPLSEEMLETFDEKLKEDQG